MTPRSLGIRLHKAFERATTREEIFAALKDMQTNGELSNNEYDTLCEQITTILDTTVAGEWFNGTWERLYSERNIIHPDSLTKRPDRVMTRGQEAVIIDYKFGEEKSILGYFMI